MRNHQLGSAPITALVLAAACWGGATVITKHVLTDVPPLTLLVLQLTVSVVFLWAIVLMQRMRLPQRRDIVRLGGIGMRLAASTPAQMQAWLASEIKRWGEVIRAAKIEPE